MLLYKYTSYKNAMEALNKSTLYWSDIDSFNDPFEGKFIYDKTLEDIARIFAITLSIGNPIIISDTTLNNILNSAPKTKFVKVMRKIRDVIAKHHYNQTIQNKETYFVVEQELLNILKRNDFLSLFKKERSTFIDPYSTAETFISSTASTKGILCLSKVKNHPLMWAHYAIDHTGVMLEIDMNQPIFEHTKKSIIKDVNYVNQIPRFTKNTILGLNDKIFPEENDQMLELHAFTKSDHWRYEEEVRIMSPKDRPGKNIYTINKKFIKSIYLGLKTSEENRREIIRQARTNFSHAHIYETLLRKDSYEMSSIRIE